MIELQSISLQRGDKSLLENASLRIHPGEKTALVGANGTGKTSLFLLLQGRLHVDKGSVSIPANWRIAHMAQEVAAGDRSALDYVLDGDTELRRIEQALAEADDDNVLATLYAQLDAIDGYQAGRRGEQLLLGLGFGADQLQRPVSSFSGGWRIRLNLAQALMCPSDLLLLDEPTNHLDLDASLWLEQWLAQYRGTLLLISHDREFLDGVSTHTLHLNDGKAKLYVGDYTAFERQRAEHLRQQQIAHEKEQAERAHLQKFIDRFKAKASKARQAQSRMKRLAKLAGTEAVRAEREFRIEFPAPLRLPHALLRINDGECGYGPDARILSNVGFGLEAGDRFGLLGPNGAG